MNSWILKIVLLYAVIAVSYAKTQSTIEGLALIHVRSGIKLYRHINSERWPTGWNEIDKYTTTPATELFYSRNGEPIQRYYVFVSQLGLLDQRRRQILMIRNAPVQERGRPEPGRYMIVLECGDPSGIATTNCEPTVRWMGEPEVRKLLNAVNVQLPPPDNEAAEAAAIAITKKMEQAKQSDPQTSFLEIVVISLTLFGMWYWNHRGNQRRI